MHQDHVVLHRPHHAVAAGAAVVADQAVVAGAVVVADQAVVQAHNQVAAAQIFILLAVLAVIAVAAVEEEDVAEVAAVHHLQFTQPRRHPPHTFHHQLDHLDPHQIHLHMVFNY